MKVAVVGSRSFNDYELLKSKLDTFHNKCQIDVIVSGGANGADSLGERWARENRIELLIFLPEWNKYGKSAGFKRNVEIVKNSDVIIAFWDGQSKGTKHTIDLASEHKKPLKIIRYDRVDSII